MIGIMIAVLLLQGPTTPFPAEAPRRNYGGVEVVPFEVKAGIEIPPEYPRWLAEELVEQLKGINKFREVFHDKAVATVANAPMLRLTGMVTKADKLTGRRLKMQALGLGLGRTKMVAHVKVLDRATGNVLLEDDFEGLDWSSRPDQLAREIAQVTKRKLILLKVVPSGVVLATEMRARILTTAGSDSKPIIGIIQGMDAKSVTLEIAGQTKPEVVDADAITRLDVSIKAGPQSQGSRFGGKLLGAALGLIGGVGIGVLSNNLAVLEFTSIGLTTLGWKAGDEFFARGEHWERVPLNQVRASVSGGGA